MGMGYSPYPAAATLRYAQKIPTAQVGILD